MTVQQLLGALNQVGRNDIEFWLKVLGVIGGLFALILTWRTHAERATFEMIDRLYSLCHVLENHALANWHMAHLFCISKDRSKGEGKDEYECFKERIKNQVDGNEKMRSELMVKEKLFAIHIFIVYEQVYYQWKNTSRFLHRRRRKFLKEMLSYFTDRLLRNPRLVAFLQEDKDGRSLHLEAESKRYIDEKMMGVMGDSAGPFVLCE
jgi:hypothetical protein